jgi:hypothetical protein
VNWRGWWGDEPPYRAPVFVLTHYPHDPIVMEGGTTFHFVTEGFDVAFERAEAATSATPADSLKESQLAARSGPSPRCRTSPTDAIETASLEAVAV